MFQERDGFFLPSGRVAISIDKRNCCIFYVMFLWMFFIIPVTIPLPPASLMKKKKIPKQYRVLLLCCYKSADCTSGISFYTFLVSTFLLFVAVSMSWESSSISPPQFRKKKHVMIGYDCYNLLAAGSVWISSWIITFFRPSVTFFSYVTATIDAEGTCLLSSNTTTPFRLF